MEMEAPNFERCSNASPGLGLQNSSPEKCASIERITLGQKSQFAQINGQRILNLNSCAKAHTTQIEPVAFELPPVVGASIAADLSAVRRSAAERDSMKSLHAAGNAAQATISQVRAE